MTGCGKVDSDPGECRDKPDKRKLVQALQAPLNHSIARTPRSQAEPDGGADLQDTAGKIKLEERRKRWRAAGAMGECN